MSDSIITYGKGGTMFAGPDAVAFFRATALWSALGLYAKAKIKPNRHWTPTVMLKMAEGITGKTYKRGEYLRARDDVKVWMDAMKAALPMEQNGD